MQKTKASIAAERSVAFELLAMVLLWFTGFILAYFTYLRSGPSISSVMRRAVCCSVSIVDLALVIVLPIVITVLICMSYKPLFLQLLCLLKGFQLSICSLSIYGAFGSAGWIAQAFLMFSDSLFSVVLWVMWVQLVLKKGRLSAKVFVFTLLFGLVIIILDAYFIAPMVISFNI